MKISRMIVGLFATFFFSLGLLAVPPAIAHADEGALAVGSAANGDTSVSLQAQAVKKYNVWVAGKRVTSKNAKNVLGNGTVSYNAKTNTLTLKNAKIKGAYKNNRKSSKGTMVKNVYRMGIYSVSSSGLRIVLKGKNTVTVTGKAVAGSYGICSLAEKGGRANVLIRGTGSLKVQAGKAGLFAYGTCCKNLNIKGKANVTLRGGTLASTSYKAVNSEEIGSYGTWNDGYLSLYGSAKLTAIGKTRALWKAPSYGQSYTPKVKAGPSASSIKVNKKNPASSVYTKYKYVSISKAKAGKSSTTSSKKPAKISLTRCDPISQGVQIQFKTPEKNCNGYRVQVSDNSSFTGSGTKTKGIYSVGTNVTMTYKYTNTGYIAGNVYYVRAQAVNTVGSKTYYGSWSSYIPFAPKA